MSANWVTQPESTVMTVTPNSAPIPADMKASVNVDSLSPDALINYGELCGRTMARAHARAGDPVVIAGYLGKGEGMDEAVARFAVAYAGQTDRDHDALVKAARSKRVPVAKVS